MHTSGRCGGVGGEMVEVDRVLGRICRAVHTAGRLQTAGATLPIAPTHLASSGVPSAHRWGRGPSRRRTARRWP